MTALLFFLFLQQATDWFQVWPDPSVLIAVRTSSAIHIDGDLNEQAWHDAEWSEPFVDITGSGKLIPIFRTRTAIVWNDTALFVAARLEERHVWGTLTKRDTIIYYDNDFEFFFDPDGDNHRYGEVEINALNTVWDLLLEKPYRDGGSAMTSWNLEGLQHAVHIDGTLNDPSDTDNGWTLEFCIPWTDIEDLTASPFPPIAGSTWRINFSRVQWSLRDSAGTYIKEPGRENNWVWSPIGIVNMHVPERWGRLIFADDGQAMREVQDESEESARRAVMEGYHAQKKFRKENQRFARTMKELNGVLQRPLKEEVVLRSTDAGYELRAEYDGRDGSRHSVGVTRDGKLFREKRKD